MSSTINTQHASIADALVGGKKNPADTAKSAAMISTQATPTLAATMAEINTGDEAFSLNLSADAQKHLSSSKAGGASASVSGFALNERQQALLDGILNRYAQVEVNGENYTLLYDELEQYGLSPEQLSLQEKVSSFDSTTAFMQALSGQTTDIAAFAASYSEVDSARAEEYMMGVVIGWQEAYDAAKAAIES